MENELTQVQITKQTKARLQSHKLVARESYNEIIIRLLNNKEEE